MNPSNPKIITFLQAIEKIKRYCAYQERCQQDVRCKLREWRIGQEKTEWIIGELISEGYINEERFAKTFARGKFNIKSWGKQKIIAELKRRNISDYCIKQALSEINEENYIRRLDDVAAKWLEKHKNETVITRKQKLFRYLSSKGYQSDEVWDFINKRIIEVPQVK